MALIDELQQRASVGNLVDQIVKAVGENGGEVSRNLGRTLRDNPLPALLTGVGLVWLMASSGRPRHEWERWEDDEDDDRRYFAPVVSSRARSAADTSATISQVA